MLAGGLLAAMNLQAAPLPGFVLSAQTEHFSFYSRDHQKVDAQKTERYLAQIEQLLGQQVPGRAEYYRYATAQELAAGTGTYAAGLTFARSGQIHSTQEFHAHEIVHLVAGQMGNPGVFFQEGLAVAIGNEAKWQGKGVDQLARGAARSMPVSKFVARFDSLDSDTAYAVAGSFVNRLIKTHGIAKVAQFFRACGPSGTDVPAAFARTFGQSLDEAGAAWAASL
ncbi:MAG: hypothetical protein DMF80_20365 [Acidobacteria bacterium]|nr:MAG: hypothetical protein DMF80_20365 [Acidobacteriota bacterium]